MKPFNVLDPELNVLGNHFLEASAGTGKTFAIEHVFVRLLLQDDHPINIDQILVVTFTRAATRELKMRIRNNLEKHPHHKKIEQALVCFDQAQIFTIHGFCHRMLTQFAFEAGLGINLSDPDDKDYKAHLRQQLSDFFRTSLKSDVYSSSQIASLLKKYEQDSDQILDALLMMLEEGSEIKPRLSFQELYQLFISKLQEFPTLEKEKVLSDLESISSQYKGMLHAWKECTLLAEIIEKKRCTLEEFDQLIHQLDECLKGFKISQLKVRAKLIDVPWFEQSRELFSIIKEAKDPRNILLRMAFECQMKWREKLPFQEKISPDEILKKMEKALQNPAFLARVQEQYKAAIIDEFQDTDPIQWRIFDQLFLKEKRPIAFYLVGDPKQSIYGFRNADLYTYLQAAEKVGEKSYLDINYRSHPPLIDALNVFFSSTPWIELPTLNQSWQYAHVKPGNKTDNEGGLHFLLVKADSALSSEEDILFPYITQELDRLGPCKTAVLVKDRFQAKRLHSFFKKCGILSVVKRGEDLKQSPIFSSMEEVLTAIENPYDASLLKQALGSPIIRWDSQQLLDEEKMQEAKLLFIELQILLDERGWGPFFQKFEAYFSPFESPAYRQLVATILERGSFQELKHSKEMLEMREEEKESAVVIMTTHMSKGLEFDVVFALGLAFRYNQKDDFTRLKGEILISDPENALVNLAYREQDAEKLRQLYVALTRAKKHVYVPLLLDDEKKRNSPIELFFQKAVGSLEDQAIISFLENLKEKAPISATHLNQKIIPAKHLIPTPIKDEKSEPSVFFAPETILSFSGIAKTVTTMVAAPTVDELPIGSETGTLVHRIFEKIFAFKLHHPYSEDKIKKLIENEAKNSLFEAWQENLFIMVKEALHKKLGSFALVDIASENILYEMEFLFPVRNGFLKGFADLCFSWEGKYYLLDWKTNWLSDYSSENLNRAMEEHNYFLQAAIYSEALERYVKLFDNSLEFGGALYYFLRRQTYLHFFPDRMDDAKLFC